MIDVWWARRADRRPELDTLLDSVEQARRDRFHFAADRDRFVVGAALARIVLARSLGVPAAQIAVERECGSCGRPHGRPRVAGGGPRYSVSHDGEVVVVAVESEATGCADAAGGLGVDVEHVDDTVPVRGDLVLADGETAAAGELWSTWVRKEAYLKATGEGLTRNLRDIGCAPVGTGTARPIGPVRGEGPRGVVYDLLAPDGYVAALAVLGPTAGGADEVVSQGNGTRLLAWQIATLRGETVALTDRLTNSGGESGRS